MEDTRVLDMLDKVLDIVPRLDERVKNLTDTVQGLSDRIDEYNHVTGRMERMEENCARVQEGKKRWKLTPGSMIGGIVVGIILSVIGQIIAQWFR